MKIRKLVAVVTVAAVAPACAALDKKNDAELLRGVPERVAAKRSLTGTLQATVAVKRTPLGTPPPAVALRPPATNPVRMDFTRHRSVIDATVAEGGSIPVTMFSEDIVYQRRIGQAGEGTTQGRPWVKLSFRGLYERRDGVSGTGYGYSDALNPAYLIDALKGTLTGSVERRGTEDIGGTRTTRYDINIGLDKAFSDTIERRREGIEAYASVSAVSLGRAARASVWVADDRLPRRISLTLSQRRDVDERVDITYVFDIASYGAAVDIHLPKRKEIATVTSMGRVLAATSSFTANVDPSSPIVPPSSTVPAAGATP